MIKRQPVHSTFIKEYQIPNEKVKEVQYNISGLQKFLLKITSV